MYEITNHFIILQASSWYNAQILLKELTSIRAINFNVVEQRQQALERLAKLVTAAPFEKEKRFAEGLWVCESLGDWTRKFMQLKSALSYKDHDSQKTRSEDSGKSDAITSFWNATTSMIDILVRLDNVWNRESFEATFSLIWWPDDQWIEDAKKKLEPLKKDVEIHHKKKSEDTD